MLDLLIMTISLYILFISDIFFYIISILLGIYLIYQIKLNFKQERKIDYMLRDIELINNLANYNSKNKFIYIIIWGCIFHAIFCYIYSFLSTECFKIGTVKILLLIGIVLLSSPLHLNSKVSIDFEKKELYHIEKYYDIIFYRRLKNIKFNRADAYNKNIIVTSLVNLRNKMLNYVHTKNIGINHICLGIINGSIAFFICGFKLSLKILMCYPLFYFCIFNKYNKELDILSKEVIELSIKKTDRLGYIFSEYRNMMLYNTIKRNNTFAQNIKETSNEISEKKIVIGKTISNFTYKIYYFNALIAFLVMIYFQKYKNSLQIYIGWAVVAIYQLFTFGSHLHNASLYLGETYQNKLEYNKGQIHSFKNENYSRYLKDISKDSYIIKNDIYIQKKLLKKKIVYLKGESGKGKTTILKSLLYYNNKILNNIAYLQQDMALELNNLKVSDIIQGFEKTVNEEYIQKAIKIACIADKFHMNTIIRNVSGGEKQRFMIARVIYNVLVNKITILIMDEPDNNLDFKIFRSIITNINKVEILQKIIFTSHQEDIINYIDNTFIQIVELI
jgi:ABC-type ATPase involved in cell division